MNQYRLHPALFQLWRNQATARRRKMLASFRSPRRKLVSILAVVLTFVWLGQTAVGILFRQSAGSERLAVWIPVSLAAYAFWHWVKNVSTKPVDPFEWTPAEIELLSGAPLSRTSLILYRAVSIFSSAVLKSVCFCILMIPDLNSLLAGFLGMLSGLLIVDLIRVLIGQLCFGLPKVTLRLIRTATQLLLAVWIGMTVFNCLSGIKASGELASPGALLFVKTLAQTFVDQATTYGTGLLAIFNPAVDVILADSFDASLVFSMLINVLLIAGGLAAVNVVDGVVSQWRIRQERAVLKARRGSRQDFRTADAKLETLDEFRCPSRDRNQKIFVPLRLRGAGSIAWRQFLGAWHYRGTMAVSLGVPILLCCLPLLSNHLPFNMMLSLVTSLVFYSFLLLPLGLILDYRRDVHRLDVLKSLPISPLAVTLGQLAVPVGFCMLYQWIVLIIASLAGAITISQAMMAVVLLLPITVLIFATENLMFMVAPYRRNQEGVSMFLRTILTFTAKGILLAIGLAVTLVWALLCQFIAVQLGASQFFCAGIFGGGIWMLTSLSAVIAVGWLANTFEQLDPSLDMPAIS